MTIRYPRSLVLVALGFLPLVAPGCGSKGPEQIIIVEGPLDSPEDAVRELAAAANAHDLDAFQRVLDARSRELFSLMLADSAEINRAERDADFEFEKALDEAFGVDPLDESRAYVLNQKHRDLLRGWKDILPQLAAKVDILEREEETPDCVRLRLRFWGQLYEGAPLHEAGDRPARGVKEGQQWKLDIPWLVKADPELKQKRARYHRQEMLLNRWFVDQAKSQMFANRSEARKLLDEAKLELQRRQDSKLFEALSGTKKQADMAPAK